MTDWTIRRAVLADAETLSKCFAAAYARYQAAISDLPDVAEGMSEDIENHDVWVAEGDGSIIAGIVLMRSDAYLLVANVAVHPNYTGQGLAADLMALAEKECLKGGLSEMRLSTHVKMPENVRFYQHLGWEESERSGHKIYMRKRLQ